MANDETFKISFPKSFGIADIELPLVKLDMMHIVENGDGTTTEAWNANDWDMAVNYAKDGSMIEGPNQDTDPAYVRDAIIAWVSWYAGFVAEPAADAEPSAPGTKAKPSKALVPTTKVPDAPKPTAFQIFCEDAAPLLDPFIEATNLAENTNARPAIFTAFMNSRAHKDVSLNDVQSLLAALYGADSPEAVAYFDGVRFLLECLLKVSNTVSGPSRATRHLLARGVAYKDAMAVRGWRVVQTQNLASNQYDIVAEDTTTNKHYQFLASSEGDYLLAHRTNRPVEEVRRVEKDGVSRFVPAFSGGTTPTGKK